MQGEDCDGNASFTGTKATVDWGSLIKLVHYTGRSADELLGLPPKGAYALVKDAHDLLEHVSAIVERGMVGAGESHVRARLPPANR